MKLFLHFSVNHGGSLSSHQIKKRLQNNKAQVRSSRYPTKTTKQPNTKKQQQRITHKEAKASKQNDATPMCRIGQFLSVFFCFCFFFVLVGYLLLRDCAAGLPRSIAPTRRNLDMMWSSCLVRRNLQLRFNLLFAQSPSFQQKHLHGSRFCYAGSSLTWGFDPFRLFLSRYL